MTKDEAIRAAFAAFGSNEIQSADAVTVLGSRVTEKGGAFFYNDAGSKMWQSTIFRHSRRRCKKKSRTFCRRNTSRA